MIKIRIINFIENYINNFNDIINIIKKPPFIDLKNKDETYIDDVYIDYIKL